MRVDLSKSHPDMDYRQHEWTYKLFLKLTLYATVAVAAVLVGMALFLT